MQMHRLCSANLGKNIYLLCSLVSSFNPMSSSWSETGRWRRFLARRSSYREALLRVVIRANCTCNSCLKVQIKNICSTEYK